MSGKVKKERPSNAVVKTLYNSAASVKGIFWAPGRAAPGFAALRFFTAKNRR